MYAALFGARAQVILGAIFLALTVLQTAYWLFISEPNVMAVFLVSMEALGFAAYAIIATGLGFRATERVEAHVVENIEHADEVTIEEQKGDQ